MYDFPAGFVIEGLADCSDRRASIAEVAIREARNYPMSD